MTDEEDNNYAENASNYSNSGTISALNDNASTYMGVKTIPEGTIPDNNETREKTKVNTKKKKKKKVKKKKKIHHLLLHPLLLPLPPHPIHHLLPPLPLPLLLLHLILSEIHSLKS